MLPFTTVMILNKPAPEICGLPLPSTGRLPSNVPFPAGRRGGSEGDVTEGEGDGLADVIGDGLTFAGGEADGESDG